MHLVKTYQPLLSIFLICFIFGSRAQEPSNFLHSNIVPPSPSVAALDKFVDIPVSLYTGTPNINIPIWTAEGRSLSVPISLSYHASGVKVDELPGWVGSNWALNAGGVISRTMRGKPDEMAGVGYLDVNHHLPDPDNGTLYSFIGAPDRPWITQSADGIIDLSPDIFYYHINGRSGKFVFGEDDQIYTIPHEDILIEKTLFAGKTRWTITAEDGTKYLFGIASDGHHAIENTFMETVSNNTSTPLAAYESSWHLVEIIAPFDSERIQLHYQKTNIQFDWTADQTDYYATPLGNNSNCEDDFSTFSETFMQVGEQQLSSIESLRHKVTFVTTSGRQDALNNSGSYLSGIKIVDASDGSLIREFDLKYDYFDGIPGSNMASKQYLRKRLKLESVQEKLGTCEAFPPYIFSYHEEKKLPARLSHNKDHWGYSNGQYNIKSNPPIQIGNQFHAGANRDVDASFGQLFLKAGTLREITFPSGGSTTFEYEGHECGNFSSQLTEVPLTAVASIPVSTTPAVETTSISIDHGQYVQVFCSFSNQNLPEVGGEAEIQLANGILVNGTDFNEGTTTGIIYLAPGNYILKAMTSLPGDQATISINYTSNSYDLSKRRKIGGLRIKKITTHDGISIQNDLVKIYKYSLSNEPDRSSGLLVDRALPLYSEMHQSSTLVDDAALPLEYICHYTINSSNNLIDLTRSSSGHVGYKEVEEYLGATDQNGKTVYHYISDSAYPDQGPTVFPYAPLKSQDWKRGILSKQAVYNQQNELLSETINEYSFMDSSGDRFYHSVPGLKVSYKLKRHFVPSDWYLFIVDLGIEPYEIVSAWLHPSKTIQKIYDPANGTVMVSESNFTHDSPNHMLATQSTASQSDGSTLISRMKYSTDYETGTTNPAAAALSSMKTTHHILHVPIEQTNWIKPAQQSIPQLLSSSISTFQTLTNGQIKPYQVLTIEPENPITESNFTPSQVNSQGYFSYDPMYVDKVTYSSFDNRGNLLVSLPRHGNPVAFKWGYDQSLPVAAIQNGTSTQDEIGITHYSGFESGMETLQNPNEDFWRFNSANEHSWEAHTGEKSRKIYPYNSEYRDIVPTDQHGIYLASCWMKTENGFESMSSALRILVNQSFVISISNESSNNWQYLEARLDLDKIRADFSIPQNQSITLRIVPHNQSMSGKYLLVDDIRCHPWEAMMQTYTFDPTLGMTAQEGEAQSAGYFDYDPMRRLKTLLDHRKNIVKTYTYNYANTVNSVDFTYNPSPVYVGIPVEFEAEMECLIEGQGSYSWNLGDGQSGIGQIISHTYAQPGNYQVTATVTDEEGKTGEQQKSLLVDFKPLIVQFSAASGSSQASITMDVNSGSSVTFLADLISGYPGVQYQWKLDNGNWINGNATKSFTLNNTGPTPLKQYKIRAKVTDPVSSQEANHTFIINVTQNGGAY